MSKDDLIAYIRSIVDEQHQGSQLSFAKKYSISSQYVNDILHGRRDPGQKILDAIGLKKVVTYWKDDNK
jgi:transcriptional regulator with XRE-family HTH domain